MKRAMRMAARETMDARWSAAMRRGTRARERAMRVFFCVCFGRSVVRGGDGSRSSRDARGVSAATARDLIATERGKRDDGDDDVTRAMDDDEDDED